METALTPELSPELDSRAVARQLQAFRKSYGKGPGRPKKTPQGEAAKWMATWSLWKPVRGDPREYIEKTWTKRIPRIYEGLIKEAAAGNAIPPLVVELLKAMTLMCSLSPERLKQKLDEDNPALALPDKLEMSTVDSETLMKIAGRQPTALPAPDAGKPARGKPRRKRGARTVGPSDAMGVSDR